MKTCSKVKKAGALLLTAAAVTVTTAWPAGNALTSLAATPVTEYDQEVLEKFRDNVLEYWEIPGLIEQYNVEFQNQLESFYNNPDGSMGLSKTQLLDLAADLRNEASELSKEAEDLKDEITKDEYKEYQDNIKALKHYAKQLEEASEGKTSSGQSAVWGLRETRNRQTKSAREMMREYQSLSSEYEIQKKNLEIAELASQSAARQKELGTFAQEDVLSAQEKLNDARAKALTAESALKSKKQSLLTTLGWAYDADPEILAVPEADQSKIASMNLDGDSETAISNNHTLMTKRRTSASGFGGLDKKNRELKDLEDQVRFSMSQLHMNVLQKQAAFTAADTDFQAAEANKAAADRKYQNGMISRQDHLGEEVAWLTAKAARESADLDLTAAIEEYEWALRGFLDLGGNQDEKNR